MGRYLQAIKNEVRNSLPAVVRGERRGPPPVQPYYDERPPVQPYGNSPGNELSPEQLQMIIAHAKLQGAREEIEKSRAELHAVHHAGADRIQALALAAINKKNDPVEIRYRGSAYDKRQRRDGEMKFVLFIAALLAFLIFIFWARDKITEYQAAQSAGMTQQSHKHYKRVEEYDDR